MSVPTREQLKLWMRADPGSREFEAMLLFVLDLERREREHSWRPFLLELELGVFGRLAWRFDQEREEIMGKLWLHLLDPGHDWLRAFRTQTPQRKCFAFFIADRLSDLLREEARKSSRRGALLEEHLRSVDGGGYRLSEGSSRALPSTAEPVPRRLLYERLRASLKEIDRRILDDLVDGYPVREIAARSDRCERAIRAAMSRILRRTEGFADGLAP
jgi:hypothetical protein